MGRGGGSATSMRSSSSEVVVEVEEEEVDDDIGAARDREIGGLVFLSRKIRTQRSLFLFEKKSQRL